MREESDDFQVQNLFQGPSSGFSFWRCIMEDVLSWSFSLLICRSHSGQKEHDRAAHPASTHTGLSTETLGFRFLDVKKWLKFIQIKRSKFTLRSWEIWSKIWANDSVSESDTEWIQMGYDRVTCGWAKSCAMTELFILISSAGQELIVVVFDLSWLWDDCCWSVFLSLASFTHTHTHVFTCYIAKYILYI